jgi:hypothetical protein
MRHPDFTGGHYRGRKTSEAFWEMMCTLDQHLELVAQKSACLGTEVLSANDPWSLSKLENPTRIEVGSSLGVLMQ